MRRRLSEQAYIDGVLANDRVVLSKAITLTESRLDSDQELAQRISQALLPYSGNSIRIGITGVPGVGKSTFIEAFGKFITEQEKSIAVLPVDPSSIRSGGSILGDKTRMEVLSQNKKAYIRPSPTSGSLGGITRKTRETMLLCEAAGYDYIIVETVGVGQSEIQVKEMVDFFILLLLAGAGDELQGIKKGIVEMADLIAITKADGENLQKAKLAAAEYQNALHLLPLPDSGWAVPVVTCSAIEETGILEINQLINQFRQETQETGFFTKNRQRQQLEWMNSLIREALEDLFFTNNKLKRQWNKFSGAVQDGSELPVIASKKLIKQFLDNLKEK